MTVVAVRNGVIAADSRVTHETESGGTRVFNCEKLFRKFPGTRKEAILAISGDAYSSMIFVDWYGTGKEPPARLTEGGADFLVMALTHDGLFEFDQWCRGVKVLEPFYAIGCGAGPALGAMHMGADARRAVQVACRINPYCAPPIVAWKLRGIK